MRRLDAGHLRTGLLKPAAPARSGLAAGEAVHVLDRAVASRLALTPTYVEVLGPVPPGRLAALAVLGSGAMTLVIDQLERTGHIKHVHGSKDRRSVLAEPLPD
ncbi:hypothetical protein ACQEVR_01490 [Actinomadura nitritigenes]